MIFGQMGYLMVTGKPIHRSAKDNYDRQSRWYDAFTFFEDRVRASGLSKLAPMPGERVLEIGPGTGHSLVSIARASGASYGLDISPKMCRRASINALKSGLSGRVNPICGDAVMSPFRDNTFDAVFLCFTLELFSDTDINAVLLECRRMLKGEGRICVVSMGKRDKTGMMGRMYIAAHYAFPKLVDCRPIGTAAVLTMAGFKVFETVNTSVYGLPVDIVSAKKA
jgi:ubiquinone/menaquinone biosynthesis C-methylase UbiE